LTISHRIQPALWLAAFFFAGFLIFSDCLTYPFLVNWDDDRYVTGNDFIRGFSLPHVRRAFLAPFEWNYAPLQLLSYMADYEIGGLNPAPYHFTNIVLHILNSWMVYLLIRAMKCPSWPAGLGGFLFLVHPVQVESVVWISERKNLLSLFFFLASFLAHIQNGRRAGHLLSFALFVPAVLSKSAAVVLPPILVLYDWIDQRGQGWRILLLRSAPFFAVSLVFGCMAIRFQMAGGESYFDTREGTWIWTVPVIFVRYLLLVIWPVNLAAFYDVPVEAALTAKVAGACLLGLAVMGVSIGLCGRKRLAGFWIVFFLISLAPLLHVVPLPTPMNDRYLYFPMVAVAGLLALLAGRLSQASLGARAVGMMCLVSVVVLLGFGASRQVLVWQDSETLWSTAVRRSAGSALVHHKLAEASFAAGRYERVISEFDAAVRLGRENSVTWCYRGLACRMTGRWDRAGEDFQKLSESPPHRGMALLELATVDLLKSDTSAAESRLPELKKQSIDHPPSRLYLADLFVKLGRREEARSALGQITEQEVNRCRLKDYLQSLWREINQEK